MMDAINTFFRTTTYATEVKTISLETELLTIGELNSPNITFLGEGSNVLFTKNYNGKVLLNRITGKPTIKNLNSSEVRVLFPSGLSWHDCVIFCATHNLWGIENLALIPGLIGSAPVQNIGAYGVELKDCQPIVDIVDITTSKKHQIDVLSADYGYRDSIFKSTYRDKWFITGVSLLLKKKSVPRIDYPDLCFLKNDKKLSLFKIIEAVSQVRKLKLPDPELSPNAGSFFKNPMVSLKKWKDLQLISKNTKSYLIEPNLYKLAAASLIESCQLKGYIHPNGTKVSDKHALILLNPNASDGWKVKELAMHIQQQVFEKFAIKLEFEIRIYS